MRSWMADPITDDGTAYYGNSLVHRSDFTVDPGTWVCLEVHVRLNDAPGSGAENCNAGTTRTPMTKISGNFLRFPSLASGNSVVRLCRNIATIQ